MIPPVWSVERNEANSMSFGDFGGESFHEQMANFAAQVL
jgi:hypothetical protein